MIVFKFINRVSPSENQPWTEEMEIRLGRRKIDVLLVGSSIWDMKRYCKYRTQFLPPDIDYYDLLQMGTLWFCGVLGQSR